MAYVTYRPPLPPARTISVSATGSYSAHVLRLSVERYVLYRRDTNFTSPTSVKPSATWLWYADTYTTSCEANASSVSVKAIEPGLPSADRIMRPRM